MANADEHHVYFAVFDFGDDPAVVTHLIGIEPTEAWIRGERYPNKSGRGVRTHSRWVLQSRLAVADPIEAHLRELLPLLEKHRDGVRETCQRFRANLAIAAYFRSGNPVFHLAPELIVRIAALGIGLDFDLYCWAHLDQS